MIDALPAQDLADVLLAQGVWFVLGEKQLREGSVWEYCVADQSREAVAAYVEGAQRLAQERKIFAPQEQLPDRVRWLARVPLRGRAP